METTYIVAVVIYNRKCYESETCKNLERIRKYFSLRIIIADNSTIETNNKEYCRLHNWEYLEMGGNVGLSKAYNKILDYVNTKDFHTIIVWVDDDTEITEEFFKELDSKAENSSNTHIFVPIIYGTDGIIYSPNTRRFFRNKLMTNENDIPVQSDFNAINSCMAIRMSVFDNYRYDENLFMDSVDQKYCEDMHLIGYKFCKLNIKITQHFFQRSEGLTAEKAWNRYKIRIHDFMYYANKNFLCRWLGIIKVCAWGIQIGIKCKSISFMMKCVWLSLKYAVKLSFERNI